MVNSRVKGRGGERELLKILETEFRAQGKAVTLQRNLTQTRCGGADCLSLPGWAIEVKRQEVITLSKWWRQCIEQAQRERLTPAL